MFAAEPDVQNPIAITTDERGRLWVAENYTWAGAGAGGFDAAQRDRIVILEDTDGDGRHDKRTVFWDQAHKLTSVEVGFGGVWAHLPAAPAVHPGRRTATTFPTARRVVVLDGFDEGSVGTTSPTASNGGPTAGCMAGTAFWRPARSASRAPATRSGSRSTRACGAITRTRDVVEAVMHGMTNSWGFDFDEHGEMFVINTVIGHLWHVVPGAHTERMYGADINPHAYQLIEQTADHVHWDTGEVWSDVRKGRHRQDRARPAAATPTAG